MKRYILFIVLTLCFATTLYAENKCIAHGEHESVSYAIIDRTDILADTSKLSNFLASVKESIKPAERLVIASSSDSTANTNILFDLVLPKSSIWESTMKIRAAEKKFSNCISQVESTLTSEQEETKWSALIETLNYFASVIKQDSAIKSKRFFIFSDMVQNSKELSFWSQKTINKDTAIKQSTKLNLLPKLPGVKVFVAGAGIGVEDSKARSIEEFWREWFKQTRAELVSYGPLLNIN